jgi:DNA-binding transcriptional LysR family regulator
MDGIGVVPVFVAVAESGGFAAAARRLGVSKSAVSKRIALLEERLGVRLFHRSTRKVSLTEAGEHYFAHAVRALGAAREAEDAVLALQGAPKGRLRINAPMSFGRLHIAPLIPEFLEIYPGISIDIVMDDRVMDLVAEGFDLAIRGGSLDSSSLIARKIAPLNNMLLAAPAYVARHGEPSVPEDLLSHNCLHYAYSRDTREWIFLSADDEFSISTTGSYRVNNGEALREAAVAGTGIARLQTFVAGPDIAAGRLVRILPDHQMPAQSLYAVFPERRHLPAKVRTFVDFIVERIGGEFPAWDRQAGLVS